MHFYKMQITIRQSSSFIWQIRIFFMFIKVSQSNLRNIAKIIKYLTECNFQIVIGQMFQDKITKFLTSNL